jgi:predicted short-subunit dehydrogenase-like oxidoreductase (DUF2520 family)
MDISVVGAGSAGTALAFLFDRAGHRVVAASGGPRSRERLHGLLPDVPFETPVAVAAAGDVVVLATPDDAIRRACEAIAAAGALRDGQVVAHLSGAVGLDALAAAEDRGARPLCLHPLQTFADVDSAIARIPGASFAVTARDAATRDIGTRLVRDVGGRPFALGEDDKALYHAAAVFASNFVVVLASLAAGVFDRIGIDDALARLLPLSHAALENVHALGPGRALTGPAVRGDDGTIRANLAALDAAEPAAIEAYVAMSRLAVALARGAGRLGEDDAARVEGALATWR